EPFSTPDSDASGPRFDAIDNPQTHTPHKTTNRHPRDTQILRLPTRQTSARRRPLEPQNARLHADSDLRTARTPHTHSSHNFLHAAPGRPPHTDPGRHPPPTGRR